MASLTDNVIGTDEWINVAILGVAAISVYFGPNTPFAPVTKFILAALSAVLTLLASVISDGISPAEWLQLVLAGLAAIGVYAVPNDDAASLSSPGHAI